jgi:hypothetical protein
VLVLLMAIAGGGLALFHAGLYGLTLFILIPIFIGALGAWSTHPRTAGNAAAAGALTALIATSLLLVVGLEGLICIAMALPLVLPLGAFGGWLVWKAESSKLAARGIAMLLLLPPAGVTWDVKARPPVFAVHTAIEVAASPEQVWKRVVMFSELPEPREWYFRAGIAYPQKAGIVGSGAGAVRYCQFSTGPFIEPVEAWEEPRLLRFGVTENPPPMHEWSPYANIAPKHLHGYLVAERGQFQLTELPNRRTLLNATTWYRHGLWPAQYWRLWSDAIIHRIHVRVLNHIRTLAEQDASWSSSSKLR